MVKATDFEFGRHVPRDNPLKQWRRQDLLQGGVRNWEINLRVAHSVMKFVQ